MRAPRRLVERVAEFSPRDLTPGAHRRLDVEWHLREVERDESPLRPAHERAA